MARIPLYNAPEQLNTGTRVLQPAQFEIADSGLAKGLAKVAGFAGDLAVSLNKKKEDLNDLSLLANLDNRVSQETLRLEKYKMENSSDDKLPMWEGEATDTVNRIRDEFGEKALTPEMRLKVNATIDRFSNSLLANTFSDSIRQKANNVSSQIGEIQKNALMTGDFTGYRTFIDSLKDKGIYSDQQLNAFELDYKASLNAKDIQDSEYAVDAYVEAGDFSSAESEIESLYQRNLISESRRNNELNKIEYRFKYNEKLRNLDTEIETNPLKVQEQMFKPKEKTDVLSIPNIRSQRKMTANESVPELQQVRSNLRDQVYANDSTLNQMLALMESEVGGMGGDSHVAFAETVLNRAMVSGKSVAEIINDKNYYQPLKAGGTIENSRQKISSDAEKRNRLLGALETALNGSNITGGATDNASAEVAAKVKRGGYNSVSDSIVDIGGETFYTKTYYETETAGDAFSWLKPTDRKIVESKLRDQFKRVGVAEFNDLKDEIDVGRYTDLSQKSQTDFDERVMNNPNLTPIMKDTLSLYRSSKIDQKLNNAPVVVADLKREILSYASRLKKADDSKSVYDEDQLEYIQLGNQIDMLTSGFVQSELRSQLTEIVEDKTSRTEYSKLSPALKLLRSTVLDSKEQETVDVPERGFWFWRTPAKTSLAYKERKVIDDKGKEVKVKEPVYRDFSEQEKQDRLTKYSQVEQNLRNYLKLNPNATPEQVFGTLVNDPIYNQFRKDTAKKTPTKPTAATAVTDKRANVVSRISSAKTKAELDALEFEVRSLNDSSLMETFNRKRDAMK